MFIVLQIVTLGLIWIYWKKQAKKQNKENVLSESKNNINVNKLIEYLNIKNIKNIEATHTKVKISYLNRDLIDVEKIRNLKGISGVFINDKAITLIVGNCANDLTNEIKQLI